MRQQCHTEFLVTEKMLSLFHTGFIEEAEPKLGKGLGRVKGTGLRKSLSLAKTCKIPENSTIKNTIPFENEQRQTLLQRSTNGQKAKEKMVNVTNPQEKQTKSIMT